MKVGYARTSTIGQVAGLEAQIRELEAAGCVKIYQEQLSSVDERRAQLELALDYLREGEVLVCTRLDRLVRSVAGLVDIDRRLDKKGVRIQILSPALETITAAGRLQFNIFASVAQFEREIMLERQREGIAKAQREGKYKGRKPKAREKRDEVIDLLGRGVKTALIAKNLGISQRSVYRIIKSQISNGTEIQHALNENIPTLAVRARIGI